MRSCEWWDLEERGDHLPGQLSGGEMQRVAIGRALINDPHIILADEPTGNLDSATSLMIFELFRELNRKGLTLVIVTHNKDLARQGGEDVHAQGREDQGLRDIFIIFL